MMKNKVCFVLYLFVMQICSGTNEAREEELKIDIQSLVQMRIEDERLLSEEHKARPFSPMEEFKIYINYRRYNEDFEMRCGSHGGDLKRARTDKGMWAKKKMDLF